MPLESKEFQYETSLEWTGGRACTVQAPGREPLVVTPPEAFPGAESNRWSPEHLFVAALQSCTMLSFLAHCSHNGVEVVSYRSEATGDLSRRARDRRYAFKRIAVTVTATVAGGHAPLAQSLTPKAERDCFISASTTADVATTWRISE